MIAEKRISAERMKNCAGRFAYAKTHGSEKGDTPDETISSKTQVGRSRTGAFIRVHVQSSVVKDLSVLVVTVGLDEIDTIVAAGNSVLS